MTVRQYGKDAPKLVLVHGGPGGAGGLECMAKEYAKYCGVLEPWQTEHTVTGQVEELHSQITEYCSEKVVLLGHSWGAWIALLYASKHPETLKSVVLMGCGPLHEKYLKILNERRIALLPKEQRDEWNRLVYELGQPDVTEVDEKFAKLGSIAVSDDYDIIEETNSCVPDGQMYNDVWPEGAAMRKDGIFLREAAKIECPIFIIHGENDPHPAEGVLEPLDEAGIRYKSYTLPKCGHSPWKEKYARDELKRILLEDILMI